MDDVLAPHPLPDDPAPELGMMLAHYRIERTPLLIVLPVMGAVILWCGWITIQVLAAGDASVALALGGLTAYLIGFAIHTYRMWQGKRDITIYTDGIAWGRHAYHWSTLEGIRIFTGRNSNREFAVYSDGRIVLRLDDLLLNREACVNAITEGLLRYWGPVFQRHLAAGEVIKFGGVHLRQDTIRINRSTIPRASINRVAVNYYRCAIYSSVVLEDFDLDTPQRWILAHYLQQEYAPS